LVVDAEVAEGADAARADDTVAGHERAQPVPGAERAGRAGGAGMAGERCELAVGDHLSARHGPERAGALAVEAVLVVELHVGEVVGLPREERSHAPRDRLRGGLLRGLARAGQLRPENALVVEPDLPYAEPGRLVPNQLRLHHPMLYRRGPMPRRHGLLRTYAPL